MGYPNSENRVLFLLRKRYPFFIGVIAWMLIAANPALAQRNQKPYYENLSIHRLKFENKPDSVPAAVNPLEKPDYPALFTVNEKMQPILDSIARFNQTRLFVDGFTILLYSGVKKEEAMNVKKKMSEEASDMPSDMQYQQPRFRVKSGAYYSKLQAQRDLFRLKKIFPNAILIPEKIAAR